MLAAAIASSTLVTLPSPPPSLAVPPAQKQTALSRPLRERIPVQLSISTKFEERPPAVFYPAKGDIGPTRGRLPRRRGPKKYFRSYDEEEPKPVAAPATEPVDKEVDAGSCLQRLVDGLYVAFTGKSSEVAAEPTRAPHFTHVISVSPERGRPGRTSQKPEPTVKHSTDEDGVQRLRLTVPSRTNKDGNDGLTADQLLAVRGWLVTALGGRVEGFMGLENPEGGRASNAGEEVSESKRPTVLVSTSGLRPGDAMSIAAAYLTLCAGESESTPGRVMDTETVLRYIDEDESVMGFWKATVSCDELQILNSLAKQ